MELCEEESRPGVRPTDSRYRRGEVQRDGEAQGIHTARFGGTRRGPTEEKIKMGKRDLTE